MIKLVASDLDGTLLFKGAQSLPEEIFPLIRQLKKMGILFVAASGRQYANMKKMFRPVVDDMAFISENGGLAVYNEKVLYQDSFEQELVREIAESIYDKEGSEFTCSTKDFYYIRPKTEHFRDLMINVVGNVCKEKATLKLSYDSLCFGGFSSARHARPSFYSVLVLREVQAAGAGLIRNCY